jgi:hypothetical protein
MPNSGIRNTTTVFDKPERDRVRPVGDHKRPFANHQFLLYLIQPRHVPPDGVLVVSVTRCTRISV